MLQVLTAVLCLSAAAACGGDDSDDKTETAGSGGTAAGNGGSGGASGSTTPPPPMPVACGSMMCYPPPNPLSGILNMLGGGALAGAIPQAQACCLDESAGTCGVSPGMGMGCEPLAIVDTRCPKANLGMLGGFVNIQPCCIENQCGQDGKLFGRGCVQNSEVASMLGPLAGGMIMLPTGVACDEALMPTTPTDHDDAGVPDTDAGI
ncbi:MAG TPA: hypothetical protein VFN67_04615 [Polyangiales bacterium]|nr:hypothetical protein [Polyangiales bacterium]